MLKKILNIFISILLFLPVFTGGGGFFQPVSGASPSFQKTCDMSDCDMGDCNPNRPKCPLCPSSGSANSYLNHEPVSYLPILDSSFVLDSASTLSDQGVIKAIFH